MLNIGTELRNLLRKTHQLSATRLMRALWQGYSFLKVAEQAFRPRFALHQSGFLRAEISDSGLSTVAEGDQFHIPWQDPARLRLALLDAPVVMLVGAAMIVRLLGSITQWAHTPWLVSVFYILLLLSIVLMVGVVHFIVWAADTLLSAAHCAQSPVTAADHAHWLVLRRRHTTGDDPVSDTCLQNYRDLVHRIATLRLQMTVQASHPPTTTEHLF